MAKIFRFLSYPLNEQENKKEQRVVVVENKSAAVFHGEKGLYQLVWYPDAKSFRLTFPDGKYLWNKIAILNLVDELNPYHEYEHGSILKWMKHVLTSEEYLRTSIVSEYVLESMSESEVEETAVTMRRFYFISDEGQAASFDISAGGLVVINIPERRVIGAPDELFDQMPELGFLWGGAFMDSVRVKFEEVTGIPFSN